MKIIYSFAAMVIACLVLVYFIGIERASSFAGSDTKRQLEEIETNYDQGIFRAFYSIEELRPYSIIQVDKIADLYDNDWMSPDFIVQRLDSQDKQLLIDKIAELVDSQESADMKKMLLAKIRNWCMDYAQITFLCDRLGVRDLDVFKALYGIDATREIMKQYVEKKSAMEDDFTDVGKNKAYFAAINYISGLDFNAQLAYFSDVYNNLAQICRY